MKEHDIQNKIRLEFGQRTDGVLFRANVGQAWTGSRITRHPDGSVTIYNARPFSSGLPTGFSDLFGVMPGGRAVFLEIKAPGGRVTEAQRRFVAGMHRLGAAAGIAYSVEQAMWICGVKTE